MVYSRTPHLIKHFIKERNTRYNTLQTHQPILSSSPYPPLPSVDYTKTPTYLALHIQRRRLLLLPNHEATIVKRGTIFL